MTWLDQAHQAMRQLRDSGQPFTADTLLELVGPPDQTHGANGANNSIGAVFGTYSATGQIVVVGHEQSRSPSRKGGLIRVWKGAGTPADTLFDLAGFGGPPRKRRVRRERPDEIRLEAPWVLLSNHNGPRAHLLTPNCPPNKDGGWRTRCGRYGYRVKITGTPMALVCHACWDIHSTSP